MDLSWSPGTGWRSPGTRWWSPGIGWRSLGSGWRSPGIGWRGPGRGNGGRGWFRRPSRFRLPRCPLIPGRHRLRWYEFARHESLLRLEAEWRVLVDYQGPVAVDPERPAHPAGHERLQPQRPAAREKNGEPSDNEHREGGEVEEVQHNELRDNQDDAERDRDAPP